MDDAQNLQLWVSISELAKLKGVDPAHISRRVAQFERESNFETRRGKRGAKLVNRAAYDRLANEIEDPTKVQAAETARLFRDNDSSASRADYQEAVTARARYDAELKKLELAERQGQLVAISALTAAVDRAADGIVRVLDGLPSRAPEIAAAVRAEDEVGARRVLRLIATDTRKAIAVTLRELEAEGLAEEAAGPITVELLDGDPTNRPDQ